MAVNYLQSVSQGVGGIMAGLKIGFMWFIMLSPLIITFVLFLHLSRYKHRIILRQKTKDKTDIVTITKFRIKIKKGTPTEAITLKGKHTLPIPPDISREITDKGRIFCECYITEGGEATWLKVTSKISTEKVKRKVTLPQLDKDGKQITDKDGHELMIEEEREVIQDIKLVRLKTEDKAFYFNRDKIAHEKYKSGGVWQFLNQHGGSLAFLIFMAMIFVFWGDIMAPAIEMNNANANYHKEMLSDWSELVDRTDQLIHERQVFEREQIYNTTKPMEAPE